MNSDKPKIQLDRYVYDWVTVYLPKLRINSKDTLRTYKRALNIFLEYLESLGIKKLTVENFSPKIINGWIQWLMESRGNSATTCNSRLASLKSFLRYLGSCDNTLRSLYFDVSDYVKPVKGRKTKVHGISKKGIKAILSEVEPNRKGFRDRTFIQILYSAALRLDEILSLTIENVHMEKDNSFITVLGKGNKIRTIPLFDDDVTILKKYIEMYHGDTPSTSDFLFYSPVRNEKGKLSQECMRKRIKLIADKARIRCPDIPDDIHPHQFRHARAQHLLEDGILNLAELSKFLGHANIETTMVYLEVTVKQKMEALSKMEKDNNLPTCKKWKNRGNDISKLRLLLGM